MGLIFPPISQKDIDNINKFKVYLNYLKCISDIFDQDRFKTGEHLIEIVRSRSFIGIQKRTENKDKIQSVLRNAWATEMQLSFTAEFSQFSCSIHWGIIQLYYSVYLSLSALFLSMNDVSPNHDFDTHKVALKKISNKIRSSPDLYPYPWNLTYSGDPKADRKIITLNNLTDPVNLESSPLSRNNGSLIPYARFLKTTRERQIENERGIWLKKEGKNKKNLTKQARQKIISELYPTTIFDCLYRLRIKANYKDVEIFLNGADIEDWAGEFNYSLINISRCTQMTIELLIMRHVGKDVYEKFVNDFQRYSKISYDAVKRRWELLSSLSYTTHSTN
ncbi:MAG TPA: hypothetical protein VHE99_11240 [Gammaproteobacteria bacterium]|nr:hypothetical protein [Gammaproteobacteria bacterium]